MAKKGSKKGSLKQLTRATHKGRATRTGGPRVTHGHGVSGSQLHVQGLAKLSSPLITGGLSATPSGPEPGRGGTTY